MIRRAVFGPEDQLSESGCAFQRPDLCRDADDGDRWGLDGAGYREPPGSPRLLHPFLDQEVGVDAPEAEAADGGAAGSPRVSGWPGLGAGQDAEGAVFEPEL